MKKQLRKRLSLSKETLRNLSEREMSGVVGGITQTCCNSCSDGCDTQLSDCRCPSQFCTELSNCC